MVMYSGNSGRNFLSTLSEYVWSTSWNAESFFNNFARRKVCHYKAVIRDENYNLNAI